jgi:hypothetical protein
MEGRVRFARICGLMTGLAGAITLAACGGGASGSTPAASATGAALQAYVSCLNQHGVKITLPSGGTGGFGTRPSGRPTARPSVRPSGGRGFGFGGFFGDPNQPPAGVDQATWSAALQACASVRPSFAPGGAAGTSQFTAYRNCLTAHGLSASARPGGFSTADPKVAAALAACEPLRPTGRPVPAPTTT